MNRETRTEAGRRTTPASQFASTGLEAEAPAALLIAPGQNVEINLFGKKVTGTIIRGSARSVAVQIPQMSDVRALRIGTRVKAVFAAHGAAAEVACRLTAMQDHITLELLSTPRLIQRRRHERLDLEVVVDLAWRDRTTGTWATCPALTRDVSGGGARLTLTPSGHDPVAGPVPGAIILLALPGRGGETTARALHVDGTQIRVEFIQPPASFISSLLNPAG